MKKVGILGGTFNPPHLGHLIIANEVLHALELDEVRFMPNATPPHKEVDNGASNEQRLEMLRLSIQDVAGFSIEPIELERGGISYSFETMKALIARDVETEFYFIVGGDSIDTLHTWYNIEELMQMVRFVGVNRPHFNSDSPYDVIMVDIPEIDLSSSLIRDRLKEGKTIRYLMPKVVEEYIRKERLYGT